MKPHQMSYDKSLFIFRRDLRTHDNTALNKALKESDSVIACFIFDPRQVGEENKYRSKNAIQFMTESLEDLSKQLKDADGKLYFFYGKASEIVEKLLKKEKIDAVFINRDYTPFSKKRDDSLEKLCKKNDVTFISCEDLLLNPPEAIKTGEGNPYSVFTPFWKNASENKVAEPKKLARKNFYTKKIELAKPDSLKKVAPKPNPNIAVHGGTDEVEKIFKKLNNFEDYKEERDFPSITTTMLSAHNKFGTASIREVWHQIAKKLGDDHPLLRQLYWRDFFTQVAYFSPYVFGEPYYEKYQALEWDKDKKKFEKWCEGKTGFPIVDAGMRQLNTTGFMHNRARLIVGSFLTKDLHLPWQWGEKYFAQNLVDYDPAVNNGNWQWVASVGCDAAPYFRIFNPWLQQKKYDPDCEYIKEWIPELKDVKCSVVHNWYKDKSPTIKNYPRPMVDHKKESAIAKKYYKKAAQYN